MVVKFVQPEGVNLTEVGLGFPLDETEHNMFHMLGFLNYLERAPLLFWYTLDGTDYCWEYEAPVDAWKQVVPDPGSAPE